MPPLMVVLLEFLSDMKAFCKAVMYLGLSLAPFVILNYFVL
jgi:hypothetical protein